MSVIYLQKKIEREEKILTIASSVIVLFFFKSKKKIFPSHVTINQKKKNLKYLGNKTQFTAQMDNHNLQHQ